MENKGVVLSGQVQEAFSVLDIRFADFVSQLKVVHTLLVAENQELRAKLEQNQSIKQQ
jgi:hypothetical protein